jgi:hypothetical protein
VRRCPQPREWSVVEILAHLLDGEVALGFRIRKVAAEPGAALVPWDQEKWTGRHDLIHLEQIQTTLKHLAHS